jgi:hypothetical protein
LRQPTAAFSTISSQALASEAAMGETRGYAETKSAMNDVLESLAQEGRLMASSIKRARRR